MKFSALMMAAVAEAVQVAHETPEQAACKCLTTTGSQIYFPTTNFDDAYQLVDTPLGDDIQYPWNYGVGQCDAHDEELFGYGCADADGNIAADAPVECAEPWCYISAECSLYNDKIESSIFDGFVYSYNKCGGDVNGSVDEAEASNEDDQDNNEVDNGEGSADNGDVVDETGVCDCLTDHGLVANEDGVIVVEYQGAEYEYVPSYGLNTCAAHDEGLEPLCTENAQPYCTAQWCYVSNDCVASDTLPSNFGGADISYSYLNCGNSADFPDNDEIDNNDGDADADQGSDDGDADAGQDGDDGDADAGQSGDDGDADAGQDGDDGDADAGQDGDDANADAEEDEGEEVADEDEGCDEACGQNDVKINIAFNVDA